METKEQIIKTAIKLFLENGFYNTSMSMIASKIGLSKPAIYYHFKDKDSMIHAVLNYFNEKIAEWRDEYFESSNSPKEFIKRLFSAIPIIKNIEKIVLNDKISKYSYSYNDLLVVLSKYKSEFSYKISQSSIHKRGIIEKIIRRAQAERSIRPDLQISRLVILIQALIEGCYQICDLDSSLKVENVSNDLYRMIWKLISKK